MTGTRIVVGAAILHRGRVLAACRSAPAELAGGWEFPGGKVEPGESESAALVRECHEELGATVRPVRRLPGAWPLARGYVLHVWLADLVAGEPRALQDHSALRWLGPDEVSGLAWLAPDRPAAELVAIELHGHDARDARQPAMRPGAARPYPGAGLENVINRENGPE
ncbi:MULTISPECIES: (deoxy)nucleoside triphosphate pyrophosphohydrolase [unclassified Embleya]|uniref:(deoxy)nucleoside triphosphate pyrophosphohydrolase n=1 Tax=unclassified Embleya TaxID=2699296 RepID=UPI0033FDD59B